MEGNRQYNPGWHLAIDLSSLLSVSEAVVRAAIERKESRGGHTREDYPKTDPDWARSNVAVRQGADGAMEVAREPLPAVPEELKTLLEEKVAAS